MYLGVVLYVFTPVQRAFGKVRLSKVEDLNKHQPKVQFLRKRCDINQMWE